LPKLRIKLLRLNSMVILADLRYGLLFHYTDYRANSSPRESAGVK